MNFSNSFAIFYTILLMSLAHSEIVNLVGIFLTSHMSLGIFFSPQNIFV